MSTSVQSELDTVQPAMAATYRLFETEVFGKRNFDALDRIYTENARILPPGSPTISGRAAIKEFWSSMILTVNATSATLATVEAIPAGDGIVEIGSATLSIRPEGQEPADLTVKYVVHWKQEDGLWKWNVDIWN